MFRRFMTCGAVDTKDSAILMINRHDKNDASKVYACEIKKSKVNKENELCKGDKLGGSMRMFGTPWNQQYQTKGVVARKSFDGVKGTKKSRNKSELSNQKPLAGAYKPVKGPNCSQCGKGFKPEKMHKHMKSCRGKKSMAKGANSATAAFLRVPSNGSSMDDFSFQEPVSGYYLTNH